MKTRTIVGAAFAICAAIVIGAVGHSNFGGEEKVGEGIRTFENYSQIQQVLSGIKEEPPIVYATGSEPVEDLAEAPPAQSNAEGAAEKGSQYSDTYIQVEGVDEADIIKTDGQYIYYTSRLGYDVVIAKVSNGKAEEAAVISEEDLGITAENLFLTGDRLVVTGMEYDTS